MYLRNCISYCLYNLKQNALIFICTMHIYIYLCVCVFYILYMPYVFIFCIVFFCLLRLQIMFLCVYNNWIWLSFVKRIIILEYSKQIFKFSGCGVEIGSLMTHKEGFDYSTITLKWCTPRGVTCNETCICSSVHRITPVDINR